MNSLRGVAGLVVVVVGLLLVPGAAQAASFSPAPGEYFIDTSALTLSDTGGTIATGVDEGGVAVFAFDSVSIPAGAEVFVEGSRPLELKSAGDFTLAGLIEASGFGPENAGEEFSFPGGPGGGAGGANELQGGFGPGGGGIGLTDVGGGGGGGFGGRGAAGGGEEPENTGGTGGSAYGDLNVALQGGSGGAGGSNGGGGGGGGGVELLAPSLTITAEGEVLADGADGNGAGDGASGGGSGGGIILHADNLSVAGLVSASGGYGGTGGCCGDGGGGGGGRIAYQYRTLSDEGEEFVEGGLSGETGPYGHGELSPDLEGAPGVITKTQVGTTATTSGATAVTPSGATLNGVVNPKGATTTYQFEFGTSTTYGTKLPASGGAVGSDSTDHSLSQGVTGLTPSTTYHYRIVATTLGFTFVGADMTFTTAPKFAGVTRKGNVRVKNGAAFVTLSSLVACKGKITLSGRIPASKAKGKAGTSKKKGHKPVKLGSASFSLAAGKSTTVKVPLTAAARKALKAGKKIKATVSIAATDSFGETLTVNGKATLKQQKKKKSKRK